MVSSLNEARYERYYRNVGSVSIKPSEQHTYSNTYTKNNNKERHNLAREYQKELMKMVSKYYEKGGKGNE